MCVWKMLLVFVVPNFPFLHVQLIHFRSTFSSSKRHVGVGAILQGTPGRGGEGECSNLSLESGCYLALHGFLFPSSFIFCLVVFYLHRFLVCFFLGSTLLFSCFSSWLYPTSLLHLFIHFVD